ncbi:MAG TPA: hypothetical protein VMB81_09175 [Candidatus Sulfotelmatobacter sp.]|nr:hypothetical protein [Candidatus Sulfotelmatobacter sp.]
MTIRVTARTRHAGARSGARGVSLGIWAALAVVLSACETGPEVVQNGVKQCIAHVKLPPQYAEPFCRCLGDELERRFNYAQIRQYRLKTDNWTFFLDVADDQKFMAVPHICQARHVPEEYR